MIASFLWLQALINILSQKDVESEPENVSGYLRPFRLIMSLLDKPDIGTYGSSMQLFLRRNHFSIVDFYKCPFLASAQVQ